MNHNEAKYIEAHEEESSALDELVSQIRSPNGGDETLSHHDRIRALIQAYIDAHRLAPRLTPEELEAKIHAVVVNKRENENWGNAIRREFSTVACGDGVKKCSNPTCEGGRVEAHDGYATKPCPDCGDGVDWKAKHASLWKCIEPLVTYQTITVIGSPHHAPLNCDQAADAAVTNMIHEREQMKARAEAAERERDALAERVKELEAKQEGLLPLNAELIVKEREDCWRKVSQSLANHLAAIAELETRK